MAGELRFDEGFRADEAVWHEGDQADDLVVILHGLVAIRRAAAGGEEALLGIFGPREARWISAVLEHGRFPADAIALSEDVEVLRVRPTPALEALRTTRRWQCGEPFYRQSRLGDRLRPVVGTHGRRGAERLLAGSVVIGVLRRATVPVAAVPFV